MPEGDFWIHGVSLFQKKATPDWLVGLFVVGVFFHLQTWGIFFFKMKLEASIPY